MNNKLSSSFLFFAVWIFILTCLVGVIGMFFPDFASKLVLLPYITAFCLMGQRFVKKFLVTPTKNERWHLSAGCTAIFWVYTFIAGLIGLMIAQKTLTPNFDALWQALHYQMFLILLLGTFLFLNSLLTGLGYWFLGKPMEKMLAYYQQN